MLRVVADFGVMRIVKKDFNMKKTLNKIYSMAGLVLFTSAAFAQNPPPPPMPPQHQHAAPANVDPAKWAEKMKERLAMHQARMHDKLKITTAQEPAWKSFIDAMAPVAMPAPVDPKAMENRSTPERLEQNLERQKERLAQMQQRLSAVKALYAVLSPEQKAIFDQSHHEMGKRMMEKMEQRMQEKRQGKDGEAMPPPAPMPPR